MSVVPLILMFAVMTALCLFLLVSIIDALQFTWSKKVGRIRFRLVEQPKGRWSVECKRLLGWRRVFFYGEPLMWHAEENIIALSRPFPNSSEVYFASEAQARANLAKALDGKSFRNIVEI